LHVKARTTRQQTKNISYPHTLLLFVLVRFCHHNVPFAASKGDGGDNGFITKARNAFFKQEIL
jgi:hypothetical protein